MVVVVSGESFLARHAEGAMNRADTKKDREWLVECFFQLDWSGGGYWVTLGPTGEEIDMVGRSQLNAIGTRETRLSKHAHRFQPFCRAGQGRVLRVACCV